MTKPAHLPSVRVQAWAPPLPGGGLARRVGADKKSARKTSSSPRRPQSAGSQGSRARSGTELLQQAARNSGRAAAARPRSADPKARPRLPSSSLQQVWLPFGPHIGLLTRKASLAVDTTLVFPPPPAALDRAV